MQKNPEKYKIKFVIRNWRNPLNTHQPFYANALLKGMHKCGFTNSMIAHDFVPEPDLDLACVWAHKQPQIFEHQKKRNKPYLILERAYIADRFHWVSLGYNGLNGIANFLNNDITDMTRWNKHFSHLVKPWRVKKDGYALVIGQVPGDWAIRHTNINQWYEDVIAELNRRDIPVVFRPNKMFGPQVKIKNKALKFTYDPIEDLEESLSHARCCVTYTSNSAVIAAVNGVPSVSCHPISMTYDKVSSTSLNNLDYTPDRSDWFAKMAYCQWLPEELEDGTAWEHLKYGLDL